MPVPLRATPSSSEVLSTSPKPLRVLHMIVSRRFAGSEQLMLTLARSQREAGHGVMLAIKPGGVLETMVDEAGLDCVPLSLGRPLSAWRLTRWLRRNRVDIIHAHLSGAVRLADRIGRRLNVPVVAHAHVYKRRSAYARIAHHGRLIAISADIRRYYADYAGVAQQRLPLVLNGVDQRFMHSSIGPAAVTATRRELGVEKGSVLITLTGRLTRQKGADLLVRAAGHLRDQGRSIAVRLFGATHHEPSWAKELQVLIEQLQLTDVVRLAGFAHDVPAVMAASDIHVVPSRYEPFGLTAIEGMAMGRPVVAAATGGLAEIIQDGENGRLFAVDDDRALATVLAELIEAPEQRSRLGARAGETVVQRYSPEAMANAVEQVYRELISAYPAAS